MGELFRTASHEGEGLGAFVDSGGFLVSILNPLPRLCPEETVSMQKHTRTDECFILLRGRAMLYLAGGESAPSEIEAVVLEPGRIYNVLRDVWHAPVMSEDASILLVENRDTDETNSLRVSLTEAQRERVMQLGGDFCRGAVPT